MSYNIGFRFLKTAEALQVKGLAQHPFLSSSSGPEEEEGEEEGEEGEEEEEEDVEVEDDDNHSSRSAWPHDKSAFKQV
jgi:hypothetical protein